MNLAARLTLEGLAYIARNPLRVLKLSAALGRRDVSMMARNISPIGRPLAYRLMVDEGVVDMSFVREGATWRCDPGEGISEALWLRGEHDLDMVNRVHLWLRAQGRREGTIVDVGANLGTSTIPFAQRGYRVVAIEPVPRTAMMLRDNLRSHGVEEQVTVLERAVSASGSRVDIWTGLGSGQAEVNPSNGPPSMTRYGGDPGDLISVQAVGVLEALTQAKVGTTEVDLVWSDSQGSESDVIETGQELWSNGVPLYVEVDPLSLEMHGGRERFIRGATSHFEVFIPRDDLGKGGDPLPIQHLARWMSEIPDLGFEDALLIPAGADLGGSQDGA